MVWEMRFASKQCAVGQRSVVVVYRQGKTGNEFLIEEYEIGYMGILFLFISEIFFMKS